MLDKIALQNIQQKIKPLLQSLYQESGRYSDALCDRFSSLVNKHQKARSKELLRLDKNTTEYWFREPGLITYVLYADKFMPESPFGKTLDALKNEVGYFKELGVDLIHVLPIMKSSGDGGFAVESYTETEPRIGTKASLAGLIHTFHKNDIRICLDFVLNHVSDAHPWALSAKNNDVFYRDFFLWNNSGKPWPQVPDIFPDFAPGHWDYVKKMNTWVWSTFYKRHPLGSSGELSNFAQWDLNYKNPNVLFLMIDNLLTLVNFGIDVVRFDAAPFLWKQRGTSCTGLPQVHILLQIFNLAMKIVAPRSIILAELYEQFDHCIDFFKNGQEIQMAYHFTLMHALWKAVAIGQPQDIRTIIDKTIPHTEAQWLILSESHDDVNLEFADQKTAEELSTYFLDSGCAPFRHLNNEDFLRGISGTTFSLLRGDLRKILLLWKLKLSLGWIPMFYMGEELGISNNENVDNNGPFQNDSRNIKRYQMSAELKKRRHKRGTLEAYLFQNLRDSIIWRKNNPVLAEPPIFFETGSQSVLGFFKKDKKNKLLILANFAEVQQTVDLAETGQVHLKPLEFFARRIQNTKNQTG